MRRPVHFEIHAADPARARKFYETVFGWTFESWGDVEYWVIGTGEVGPGINGGLVPRRGAEPAADAAVNGYVITVDVEDIDAALAKIESLGGMTVLGRQDVGDMGWAAYFKDVEGNLMGLWQNAG